MADNPFNFGNFAGNFLASPIYGLGETLAGIGVPGAQEFTELPMFSGVDDWRAEHPGWAMGAEVASWLLPGTLYAKATQKGAGVIGALTRAGANLGGSNNTLRFGLGEAARWAPLNLGATGLDAWGGRYDTPGEAGSSFLLGQAMGLGLSFAGASPAFRAAMEAIPLVGRPAAGVVRAVAGPGPEARALYGFGEEIQGAVELKNLVSQFDQSDPYQLWGRRAIDLLREVETGVRTDVRQEDVLNLLDLARRESLNERVGVGESYVNFPYGATDTVTRRKVNQEFTPGRSSSGERKRQTLLQDIRSNRDIGRIEKELSLPPGWEFLGRYYRHIQSKNDKNAQDFRRTVGLEAGRDNGFRRIDRPVTITNEGGEYQDVFQRWSIRQEDDGMWVMATELPREEASGASRFLMFKTDVPDAFFPHESWKLDIDNPNAGPVEEIVGTKAWDPISNLPQNVSPFFDHMRGVKDTILSTENFKALSRSARNGGAGRDDLVARLNGQPNPPGVSPGKFVEAYLTPTMFQFRNSPLAAQVYQMRRAVFDGADALKQEIVYGRQSLDRNKSIWGGVFGRPEVKPQASIFSEAKHWFQNEADLEEWRKLYFQDRAPLEQWPEGPAKEFQKYAMQVNKNFVDEFNKTLVAIGKQQVKERAEHVGVGHNFTHKGSNYYTVLDQENNVVALGTGHSTAGALKDANEWIAWKSKQTGESYRIGELFQGGYDGALPRQIREEFFTPGFYNPRSDTGGYRWEREKINSVDELIEAFDLSYAARARHMADLVGDALTQVEKQRLMRQDPQTYEILATRLNQLKGVQGPLDRAQNRIVDKLLAPALGVNSASKLVQGINTAMHHLSFGMGNIAYPLTNITSILQTSLPEYTTILASRDDELSRLAYFLPTPGANGKARGMTAVWNTPGSLYRATKILNNPTDAQREVFEALQKDGDLGPRFAEEYLGQNRGRVQAISEAVKSPEGFGEWVGALSNFLPAQTEKLARMYSAAIALDGFDKLARIRGQAFTQEQMIRNVQNFVRRTNYLYSTADRPAIFTTPGGALFGQMKNWMMHYLFTLADYTGLAAKGNFAPLLMAMSGVGALAGAGGIPFAMGALDWYTENFEDKDALEYLYGNLGDAANGVAFGLPGLMGTSFSGQTAAPGAKFANDLEFLASVPAWERMRNMARAVGTGWDQAAMLGNNPFDDPVFAQQMSQGFAPRSFYRAYDVIVDDDLTSAATGYPRIQNLSVADRWKLGMGFTPTEVERANAIYERMYRDEEKRKEMVGMLGEAYFMASAELDQDEMENVLRLAALHGIDQSSVLRSAQRRSRDSGVDMFGRLRGADFEAYQAALGAGELELGEPVRQ